MGSAAQNEKTVRFQDTPHVIERLYPVGIVFEALARNDCIKVVLGPTIFLTPNDEVHPWARTNVNSKIIAVAEVLPHRAVYIQGANLEHDGVVEIVAKLIFDESHETYLL